MTKEERKIYMKQYREENKHKLKLYKENNISYQKQYYKNNKEKLLEKSKQYYLQNNEYCKERNNEYSKKYFSLQENKNKRSQYNLQKYKNHLPTKITLILRCRFNNAIKKNCKKTSIMYLLGCNIKELKEHLEKQFKKEMNWENWGKIWEIDHIKPCSSFDLTDKKQQQECFNYLNLQPLFKTTNISKSLGYLNETGNRNKGNKE